MVKYGMERSTPKRKDYTDDIEMPGPNAVKARTAPDFVELRVSQPMLDQLERCRVARTVGKSWKSEGEK